jgi:hypothetical protein
MKLHRWERGRRWERGQEEVMAMQWYTALWFPNVVIADNKKECVCDMVSNVMQLRHGNYFALDTDWMVCVTI